MNTNAINKDNLGSATLLAALFFTIAAALFSSTASAKAANITTNITAPKVQAAATKTTTDTFVITATRLK